MKKKKYLVILCGCMALSLVACGKKEKDTEVVTETTTEATTEVTTETTTETTEATTEATTEEAKPEKLNVGDVVTSADWKITLTSAYTSDILQSDQSSTYWETEDGYAFLVLEMDVECLNSSKKPVDGDAIANPVATTVNGNSYSNWEYQYIAAEIWCYYINTYLDANLPEHTYVYTYIPASVMNDMVTVNITLAGKDYELTIN